MSTETYRAIRCDHTGPSGDRCNTEWSHPTAVSTFTELRRHLRDRGWHCRPGHDLCPDHTTPRNARA